MLEVKKADVVLVEFLGQLIGLTLVLNGDGSGFSIFSRVAYKASLCFIGVGGLSFEGVFSSLSLFFTESEYSSFIALQD